MFVFPAFIRPAALALLLTLSGMFTLSHPATAQDATPTPQSPYASPQFGYQIGWQIPWTGVATESGDGYETVTLVDGDITATIIFSRPGDTELSDIVELLTAGPDDATFVPGMQATDAAGAPILGSTPDRAWGAWLGNLAGEEIDGFMEFRYGEIRRLEGDLAVGLSIAMPAGEFDHSVERFSTLLDTVAPVDTTTPESASANPQRARLELDPGVPIADRQLITEAVRLAEDFFTAHFDAAPSGTVTVTALPQSGPSGSNLIAATLGDQIVVYTQSSGWVDSPPAERIRTVVHEYTHTWQFSKTAERPYESAAWFEEGVAEYLSLIALDDLGLVDRADLEGYFGVAVWHTELPPLQELERYDAMQSQPGEVYPLSYLAVDDLMQNLPLTAIDDYYTALQDGQPFAAAFEQAFGVTPTAFYDAFARYRAEDLPMNDAYPQELEITAGTDQPSAVVAEESPPVVLPGQQSLVVAQAVPGSNCTLDLTSGATAVLTGRETFTSGDGQVFWLLTIPDDTPSGAGVFTLTCGADPLSVPVLVS